MGLQDISNQLLADSSFSQAGQDGESANHIIDRIDGTLDFLKDVVYTNVNDIYKPVCGDYDLQNTVNSAGAQLPPAIVISSSQHATNFNLGRPYLPPHQAGFHREDRLMTWRRNPPPEMVLPDSSSVTKQGEQMARAATVGTLARRAICYEEFITTSQASFGPLAWALSGGGVAAGVDRNQYMEYTIVGFETFLAHRMRGEPLLFAPNVWIPDGNNHLVYDSTQMIGATTERFLVVRAYMYYNNDALPDPGGAGARTRLPVLMIDVARPSLPYTNVVADAYAVQANTSGLQRLGLINALSYTISRHEIALAYAAATSAFELGLPAANRDYVIKVFPTYSSVANLASWVMERPPNIGRLVHNNDAWIGSLMATFTVFNRLLYQRNLFALGYPELAVALGSHGNIVGNDYIIGVDTTRLNDILTMAMPFTRIVSINRDTLNFVQEFATMWLPFEISVMCGVPIDLVDARGLVVERVQGVDFRALPRRKFAVPASVWSGQGWGHIVISDVYSTGRNNEGDFGDTLTVNSSFLPLFTMLAKGESQGLPVGSLCFGTTYAIQLLPNAVQRKAVTSRSAVTGLF